MPAGSHLSIEVTSNNQTCFTADTEITNNSPERTTVGSFVWPATPAAATIDVTFRHAGRTYKFHREHTAETIIDAGPISRLWYGNDDRSLTKRFDDLAEYVDKHALLPEPLFTLVEPQTDAGLPPVLQELSGFALDPEAMHGENPLGVFGQLERSGPVAQLLEIFYATSPDVYSSYEGLTLLYQNSYPLVNDTGHGGHLKALAWVPKEQLTQLLNRPSLSEISEYQEGLWYEFDQEALFRPIIYLSGKNSFPTALEALLYYVGKRFIDLQIDMCLTYRAAGLSGEAILEAAYPEQDSVNNLWINSAAPNTSLWLYFNEAKDELSVSSIT